MKNDNIRDSKGRFLLGHKCLCIRDSLSGKFTTKEKMKEENDRLYDEIQARINWLNEYFTGKKYKY